MNNTILDNPINHIYFVLDKSGSMSNISKQVVTVFDNLIKNFAEMSQKYEQETRVTCYLFSDGEAEVLFYDKDVMRLPNISKYYQAGGNTALIDALSKALDDAAKIPELYGSHSHLIYSITDGEENSSKISAHTIASKLSKVPDNYTVACFVPNQRGVEHARKFGFLPDNIQIWDTTSKGIEKVGTTLRATTEGYMQARAKGMRSTRSLFKMDTANLNESTVTKVLDRLSPTQYALYNVSVDSPIRDFVTSKEGYYDTGSGYYQLTKKEEVQSYKKIVIRDINTGDVFCGDNARALLGLPNSNIRVDPAAHDKYEIYVQSTSVNRKLIGGTKVIVLRSNAISTQTVAPQPAYVQTWK